MKILHFVHAMAARWFYLWAIREIDPLHPDVPMLLQREAAARDKLKRITA